ncbi:MAG: hypothetical protein JW860_06325 [Sedimentisphaerales bacterium]|nr:hypothetical protein [Sedimentisphaerales bacterium]
MEEIQKLWFERYQVPFPRGLADKEIAGECLVSLDTFTAGCISSFIEKKGSLDPDRIENLVCFS